MELPVLKKIAKISDNKLKINPWTTTIFQYLIET